MGQVKNDMTILSGNEWKIKKTYTAGNQTTLIYETEYASIPYIAKIVFGLNMYEILISNTLGTDMIRFETDFPLVFEQKVKKILGFIPEELRSEVAMFKENVTTADIATLGTKTAMINRSKKFYEDEYDYAKEERNFTDEEYYQEELEKSVTDSFDYWMTQRENMNANLKDERILNKSLVWLSRESGLPKEQVREILERKGKI